MFFVENQVWWFQGAGERETEGLALGQVQFIAVVEDRSTVGNALTEIVDLPGSYAHKIVMTDIGSQLLHLFQCSKNKDSILISSEALTKREISSKLFIRKARGHIGNSFSILPSNFQQKLSITILKISIDKVIRVLFQIDNNFFDIANILFSLIYFLDLSLKFDLYSWDIAFDRDLENVILIIF